jgi:ABC-type glycerol-3-phosphate transport system permease component
MAQLADKALVLPQRRPLTRARVVRQIQSGVAYAILVVGAALVAVPFLWMVSTSLKSFNELYRIPPALLPALPQWANYVGAMSDPQSPFTLYIANTLRVATVVMAGTLASNTIVAFAFSRLRWWGRDVWFMVMLSTMMLPSQVTIIPVYILFNRLGWIDTWNPLTVPAFFASAWTVFLMRQFMMTIPLEMDDAARIDGCSTFRLFLNVIVPLSKPVIAVIAIFTFQGVWNDYFGPLIYLNTRAKWTVALALSQFAPSGGVGIGWRTQEQFLMAAAVIIALPLIVIFLTCQKLFIQGIVVSGVKG